MNGKALPRPPGSSDAPLWPYAAWTPATDTTELPALLRGNPPTVELRLLDLAPAVAPARRRRRLRGLAAEMAHVHLPAAWRSAVTVVGGIGAGLAVLAYLDVTRQLGQVLLAASTGGAH